MKKQVSIYIDKEVWEKARKYLKNISKFCEEKIKEYLKSVGEEVKEVEPKLVVIVRCPLGHESEAVLIDESGRFRSSRVYCKVCRKRFRIKGRIVDIKKGNRNLYIQWYSQTFKTNFI
jgi:uncharacterized protein YbaR (Trm112 family)